MTTVQDSKRPIWQSIPCGPWCTTTHEDGDHPDDRQCAGEYAATGLTLHPAFPVDDSGTLMLDEVRTRLHSAMPGAPTTVVLNVGDDHYWLLTLDEAQQHVNELQAQIDAARGAQVTSAVA